MTSCNGFIHFERYGESSIEEVAVVNPITREMVRVPGSPYRTIHFRNMSLGYDPQTNTYKLVQLLVLDDQNELAAAIYDLVGGGGGWRCCRVPPELYISEDDESEPVNHREGRDAGICVAGTLNWVSHQGYMVVLDLNREEFRGVRIPVNMFNFNASVELVDVGGNLVLMDRTGVYYVKKWVLKENGWM